MHVCRSTTRVEVLTPAKINLFLEVLAKRPDGYHEIETLLTAVTIYDSLSFAPTNDDEIRLEFRWAAGKTAREFGFDQSTSEIPQGANNLVWKAAALLGERARIRAGATIQLVKRIPAAAGLGGASSDAAATLVAANEAWQLGWPQERLMELAAELGSDVAFFLTRGAAVCRGRGERIVPIRVPRLHVVMVRPPVGLSTPQVYRACQPKARPVGSTPLATALAAGHAQLAALCMVNDLQPAAASLTPWIATLQTEFKRHDALGHQMTGSGSSYFGLCHSARQARRIAARLRARAIGEVFAATTAVAG